jgi:hypothetical protein
MEVESILHGSARNIEMKMQMLLNNVDLHTPT